MSVYIFLLTFIIVLLKSSIALASFLCDVLTSSGLAYLRCISLPQEGHLIDSPPFCLPVGEL